MSKLIIYQASGPDIINVTAVAVLNTEHAHLRLGEPSEAHWRVKDRALHVISLSRTTDFVE